MKYNQTWASISSGNHYSIITQHLPITQAPIGVQIEVNNMTQEGTNRWAMDEMYSQLSRSNTDTAADGTLSTYWLNYWHNLDNKPLYGKNLLVLRCVKCWEGPPMK